MVEHDLAVLDYLSDFICCLYGTPSAYGVVTMPSSVREGINIFLAGFVPTENLRFRDESLDFKVRRCYCPLGTAYQQKGRVESHYLSQINVFGVRYVCVPGGWLTSFCRCLKTPPPNPLTFLSRFLGSFDLRKQLFAALDRVSRDKN